MRRGTEAEDIAQSYGHKGGCGLASPDFRGCAISRRRPHSLAQAMLTTVNMPKSQDGIASTLNVSSAKAINSAPTLVAIPAIAALTEAAWRRSRSWQAETCVVPVSCSQLVHWANPRLQTVVQAAGWSGHYVPRIGRAERQSAEILRLVRSPRRRGRGSPDAATARVRMRLPVRNQRAPG